MDILIVDDQKPSRLATSVALESLGHYVEMAENGRLALQRLKEENFDLVFLNLVTNSEDGLQILKKIVALKPQQLVTLLSTATQATPVGAFDCLEKPITAEKMQVHLLKVRRALQSCGAKSWDPAASEPSKKIGHASPPLRFSSDDEKTRAEFDVLFRAAATSASILILGESGTGKSVVAREIHDRSHLKNKPFVTINCPSLSKELLESVLFGHVKGSFTGAIRDTWGKIHAADGGTLFLDEIGELPLEIQPKLLRILQEHEYERLGENKVRMANVRVIAATNRDLKSSIRLGEFREDLYYRLNVISVTVPPLRQRPVDLDHFATDYLEFFASQLDRKIDGFSDSGRSALRRHNWPGNLRELRNAIERATILAHGSCVEAEDLPRLPNTQKSTTQHGLESVGIGGEHSLDKIEQAHLTMVLGWAPSLHDAAAVLGIDKATLYRKRKRFGMD
jgi:NtrC-family two-component system response regulator AlgB